MAEDSFVDNHGVRLAVRDYGGSGRSVLLIHGAGRSLADWALIAPLMARGRHVVAMDVRGHGRSDEGPWDWENVLEDTHAVIRSLRLEPVALVGHSLGGMVAALYGTRFPGISAAVNLDGHGKARPDQYVGIPADEIAMKLVQVQAVEELLRNAPTVTMTANEADAAREAMKVRLDAAGIGGVGTEVFDRTLAVRPDGNVEIRPTSETTRPLLACVEELDVFALYRRVACPLLVYQALRPGPVPPGLPDWWDAAMAAYRLGLTRDLEAVARDHPHVEVQSIDATHALILEEPHLIVEQLDSFLDRNGA